MSRFKVGDKVRVKKFKTRPDDWNSEGKMDRYSGEIVTITRISLSGLCSISEDSGMWLWSENDFAPAEFTKADLEDGMIVELRNGLKMIWLYGHKRGSSIRSSVTNDDLTGAEEAHDIVKVGYPDMKEGINGSLKDILSSDFGEILWERKEKKKISSEEALAILKVHYGCEVEIKE